MPNELRNFLTLTYDELEELNLKAKDQRKNRVAAQHESDLRLGLDWSSFYWVPSDVFGTGKVMVFGEVIDKSGKPYSGDIRGVLKSYAAEQHKTNDYTLN